MSGTSIAAARPDHDGGRTFRTARGTVVGRLGPDGFLEKRGLDYAAHHLHRFGAWATEAHHLDQLQYVQGRGVRLHLSDGRTFESTIEDWCRHSYRPKGLESDQLVLPDRFWRVATPGVRQLALIT